MGTAWECDKVEIYTHWSLVRGKKAVAFTKGGVEKKGISVPGIEPEPPGWEPGILATTPVIPKVVDIDPLGSISVS